MPYQLKSQTKIEFGIMAVLFITGVFLRLYHLGGPSLSDDEISTALRINHSFLDTIRLLGQSQFPPLHYIILHLWVDAVGRSEWALRFPSAIFSSLTVIVIYKLGKELFGKSVGLLSAALLVFSPFAIDFAQFAKMYALFWFLAALSFLFFFRFLKDQAKSSYGFYILSSILCCYTMYTGFLFLVTQSMIFLLMWERQRLKKWFTGQLIIIAFCIPWVIYFLSSKQLGWCLRPPHAAFNYLTFFLNAFLRIIDGFGAWGQVDCFLYVFLISYFLMDALVIFYKNKKMHLFFPMNYYYLLMWTTIPVFLYFIFDYLFVRADLEMRYIGFLQIPILLMVSSQINHGRGFIKKALVLAMLLIAMSSTYLYFKDNLRHPQQDWRRTAAQLTQDLGKDDTVLSFVDLSMFEYYYKTDMRQFLKVSPSWFLGNNDILKGNTGSVFILYKQRQAPVIKLNGFMADYHVSNGDIGFLHFKRMVSKNNSDQ